MLLVKIVASNIAQLLHLINILEIRNDPLQTNQLLVYLVYIYNNLSFTLRSSPWKNVYI